MERKKFFPDMMITELKNYYMKYNNFLCVNSWKYSHFVKRSL